MLFSISLVCIFALILGYGMKKIHLPKLLGYLLTGLVLGALPLSLVSSSFLDLSADFRQLALLIILLRAGLSLDLNTLKKNGRPAILLSFLPACFEIVAVTLIAPLLLGISTVDAAVMGSVLAAVSPAVVVPKMIELEEKGYGKEKGIPQLIMAGASVDDIFVIVLFTSFVSLSQTGSFSLKALATTGVQSFLGILLGILIGCLTGFFLLFLFRRLSSGATVFTIITLCAAIVLVSLESFLSDFVPLSGYLAVIVMAVTLLAKEKPMAQRLEKQFHSLWLFAEILLFVFVGLAVDVRQAFFFGWAPVALILLVLPVRLLGVLVALIGTPLSLRERVFCMISYIPKATVQAAIGTIPLSLGLSAGSEILTVAVLSILITAPLGAVGIQKSYRLLLRKDSPHASEKLSPMVH